MAQAQGDYRNMDSNATARTRQERESAEKRRQAAATAGRGSRTV